MMNRLLSRLSSQAHVISGGILLLASPFVPAAKYVPPPAGPYQPEEEVVVSEHVDANDGKSDRVYKFPSEDLIRGEAPVFNSRTSSSLPLNKSQPQSTTNQPRQQRPASKPDPASRPAGQSSTAGGANYPANPWAAGNNWNRQAAPAGPAYPPVNQGWGAQYGSPQYGNQQYGGQQSYPYGYNYQNYSNSGPFNNMTAPWNMMPMQPFFPGN